MGKMIRSARRTERGAAAVEFALVAPLLLILVLGMVQYGIYFWALQGGSTAAREAARRAAVGDFPVCADYENDIRARIGNLGDGANADITRSYAKGPGNTKPGVEVGDVVTVRVEFNSHNLNIPLIPFIQNGLVESSADARVESVPTDTVGACS